MHNKFHNANITCSNVQKNKAGGNFVHLNYEGYKKIIVQTPFLSVPFGLSEFTTDSGLIKYSTDVSFMNKMADTKIETFMNKMKSLDEFMIKLAVEHSVSWFGKKMSQEVVENLYRPILKESKDPEKYAPTMKLKIRNNDDKLQVESFDMQRNEFNLHSLIPGSKVRCIIELAPVWFVNKQFGLTFNIIQIQVDSPSRMVGWSFNPEDDEDNDEVDEDDN
jgi:hypothetical protein